MQGPYSPGNYPQTVEIEKSMYHYIADNGMDSLIGIFHIMQTASVYLIAIAVIIGAITLAYTRHANKEKASQNKSRLIRILILAVFIFGVSGILGLVASAILKP